MRSAGSAKTRFRLSAAALLLASLLAALAAPAAPPVRAVAVDGVRISVSELPRAVEFYTRVLDFRLEGESEVAGDAVERLHGVFAARTRTARLSLGSERVDLVEWLAPRGRAVPVDARSNDLPFQHVAIVVSDLDRAYARLREHRVTHVSPGPQRLPDWNPNAGGIRAFYFRDPDGHPLEVISYPPGKGDPRWQAKDRLFLGIDHTAIVVSDTEASLGFWRDELGLEAAGGSENHGIEQERLNAVFCARLRITVLRAKAGIGVELLEYLAPRDGRPWPEGTRPNDLLATLTLVQTAGPDRLVRDPDGHFVLLSKENDR